MVNVRKPAVSVPDIVYLAVQLKPDGFVTIVLLPLIFAITFSMFSSAVNEIVTSSPTFALVVSALSEEIYTNGSVGLTLSKVTLLPLVMVVTVLPLLPAISLKSILKVTVPSGPALVMV